MKLHLGCGERYLAGYTNIDYPPNEHTVQKQPQVDRYADLVQLNYPPDSVAEIRLHHVFEHFPRPVALALLCRWRDWLATDGLLHIETPDALASAKIVASPFATFDTKQQVLRHLFGSHEANWAVHWDGWYAKKFQLTLQVLGFGRLKISHNKWGALRNVEVRAQKNSQTMVFSDYLNAVRRILAWSTVRVQTRDPNIPEGSEAQMLEVWIHQWQEVYRRE